MQSDTESKTHEDLKTELLDRYRVYCAEVLRDSKTWPKGLNDDFTFIYKLITDLETHDQKLQCDVDQILNLLNRMNNTAEEIAKKQNDILINMLSCLSSHGKSLESLGKKVYGK